MNLDEWVALPEGELVNGELVAEEVVDFVHEEIVSALIVTIRRWVLPRGGFVYGSGGKFALGPGHGRKPDLSVFLPGGAVPPRHGAASSPPDIMVEILSRHPRDVMRDRVEKADAYAIFGVRFYWIIDPGARTLEIVELDRGHRWTRVLTASAGAVEVPGCPELRIDLDTLWTEVDRLVGVGASSTF